jgi:cytochrome c5
MILVSACGGSPASPTAAPVVTPGAVYPVAGTPAPGKATAVPVYPVALDGKALVSERCTVCHDTGRIQSARKSTADWQSTVARMKSNGARLNDAETAAVIAYVAATFK